MASACSTHPPPAQQPSAPPAAAPPPEQTRQRLPTPLLSSLSPQWQAFACEFGLSYRDVLGLMSFDPVLDLDAEKLVIIANQLEAALRTCDWPLCEALICMLVRSDLRPVFDACCDCGLGWVATVAARKDKIGRYNGSGTSEAGTTARLGYVLAVQLERMAGAATQAEVRRQQRKACKRKRHDQYESDSGDRQ